MPDIFDSGRRVGSYNSYDLEERDESRELKDKTPRETPTGAERHEFSGHAYNPLAAYQYYPRKVKFVNQDPEEVVVLLLRKHPFTNLGWMVLVFAMIVAPSFLPILTFLEYLPTTFKLVFVIIWYLISLAFAFEKFLNWFFHVNIITDERIIEVDFINLFYREITQVNIDQIQEVTVEMGGGLRTFLSFGDVIVQTAAEFPKVEFEKVPQPDKVARVLRDLEIEEQEEKLEGRVR